MATRIEQTSERIARIAALGMKHPERLTLDEIQSVCASAVTQARNKKPLLERIFGGKSNG